MITVNRDTRQYSVPVVSRFKMCSMCCPVRVSMWKSGWMECTLQSVRHYIQRGIITAAQVNGAEHGRVSSGSGENGRALGHT